MTIIGSEFLRPDFLHGLNHMCGMQYQILHTEQNSTKKVVQFVCTIPTQNIIINLNWKPPFSRLLGHSWVKVMMLL